MRNVIPRSEYPRPDFVREKWQNLNGEWEFYNDLSASGRDRRVFEEAHFDGKIIVPFCPESKLSGVEYVDFMPSVWYARSIQVTEAELKGRVRIHFGACDYLTRVYVNGTPVGHHVGGYTSFSFDITGFLHAGENRIVVHAEDDVRSGKQPRGKQCAGFYSRGCDYTRTTGIWQTVWLEYLPSFYLKKVKINATDLDGVVHLETTVNHYRRGATLRVEALFDGQTVAKEEFSLGGVTTNQSFKVSAVHLWNVGEPNLYDLRYTLCVDGKEIDTVESYFGIRRIDIDGVAVRINGKSVFQRLILDQGFYPDGIYTAPTDADLVRDIEYSMNLGFNGARLHQKVFEARFLYHADRMGYLVWGEYPNWGLNYQDPMVLHTYLPEWLESVERDYNHPSIIGWCPYNETINGKFARQIASNISCIYLATKAADPTRPVIDTSGYEHTGKTDIYDIHAYSQDVAFFKKTFEAHAKGEYYEPKSDRQRYNGGVPFMVSEYGGIKWVGEQTMTVHTPSWGYGDAPKTMEEFTDRYCGLTEAIMQTPNIMGFCYTQLTDIEQETNGLYYYDRTLKFPKEFYDRIRATNTAKAAIED